jgi:hypothetical protein
MLDRQLSAAILTPGLSPAFRASLAKRIRRVTPSALSELLPDMAHIAGCACALVVCLIVLPFPTGPVILAGLTFTFVTYFFQSALRDSLE